MPANSGQPYNPIVTISTPSPGSRIVLTQANFDKHLWHTAANALLNRALEPYGDVNNVDSFPEEAHRIAHSILKAYDAILHHTTPFTLYVAVNSIGDMMVEKFVMASSGREKIYVPSIHACDCEGFRYHGNCYHRVAAQIFNDYITLIQAHEALKKAYNSLGIKLYEITPNDKPKRDPEEEFIDRMMSQPTPPQTSH